jgi:hypothetical protein
MLKLSELKITLQYHDELNPKLWDGDVLKKDVRNALIKFGQEWSKFAKIPKDLIQDIVMTGGNANYNYTGKSDIDVHVIIDRSKLFHDAKFVEEYLQDKKSLWTLTHNIDVYGYPLEPYAQDDSIKYPKNQGVYSLMKNEWIVKPIHCNYDFKNDHLLKQKVKHYMHAIDHMIKHHMGQSSFDSMKQRFKDMRTASLQQYGEFGRENLVFKELRNRGYIDKMNKYQASFKDKELSLK